MLPSAAPADEQLDHCGKDALTGFLGLMLQAVLAGLAFTCLIGMKRVSLKTFLLDPVAQFVQFIANG